MVIGNLDIMGVAVFPKEADSPLIIDPDAPLARAIAGKQLQLVARRDAKKVERGGAVKLFQFALCQTLHILRQLCRKAAIEQFLCFFTGK